jgi:2-polyprenyl-6-methoxyphenol hydroxylase-like FAD-dependent oxidoreductase
MDRPLIVGAGPVGVGAAMFLSQAGRQARVIEIKTEPATQSRALAVNPRTLTLLESTGVTEKMLELGKQIRGMQFHRAGKVVAQVSLADLHPKYPFLLALSQATTEKLLYEAFVEAGGTVERGIEMTECRNVGNRVEAVLQRAGGGDQQTVDVPWLLAADGAHSVARHQLQVDFPGSTLEDVWYLADVHLKSKLTGDFGHIYFFDDSAFLFMLRVVDDKRTDDPARPVWRILGNRPDPCSFLARAESELMDPPIWESSFHVSHRIDATLNVGQVYFAGDAAHIHSPMGARGMNLGLEDAFIFAGLETRGRLAEYNRLRHPVDARVVHQVEFFSRLMTEKRWYFDFVRRHVFPLLAKTPFQKVMKQTASGLDHELPQDLLTPVKCCSGGAVTTIEPKLCASH